MLSRVRIAGFRSLADVELQPGRLTVLIGPNGAGKSNVLSALKLLPLMRTESLQRVVGEWGGADSVLHYGRKRTPVMELVAEFTGDDQQRNRYITRLGHAANDRLIYLEETVSYRPSADDVPKEFVLGAGHWESNLRDRKHEGPTVLQVNWWLSQLSFFHFHDTSISSALRTHARSVDDRFLRSDGSNLAAFLARLAREETDAERKAFKRIQSLVKRVAPVVKELRPTPVGGNGDHVRLDWVDDHDEVFGAHQLSDGTLRAVALIAALAQPTDMLPRFISIDEPELGLHPAAIGLLAELARSVSHKVQVLFATQSTAFLNHFDESEIVVVERANGATVLRRPEPEPLAEWLERYTLSEVFEKGVIGGQP